MASGGKKENCQAQNIFGRKMALPKNATVCSWDGHWDRRGKNGPRV